MDFFGNHENLQLLQKLLSPDNGNSSDEDDHLLKTGDQHMSPSDLASMLPNKSFTAEQRQLLPATASSSEPKTIDEWEEREALLTEQELDNRKCPSYNIIYKQSVTPEDIFLQMSSKTATTASCEEMCLEIAMPEENISVDDMELDIESNSIDLKTPVYRLKMPLVQSIDPDQGRAVWDDDRKMLTLTLRMKREFDFINF